MNSGSICSKPTSTAPYARQRATTTSTSSEYGHFVWLFEEGWGVGGVGGGWDDVSTAWHCGLAWPTMLLWMPGDWQPQFSPQVRPLVVCVWGGGATLSKGSWAVSGVHSMRVPKEGPFWSSQSEERIPTDRKHSFEILVNF